ncbi:hypothetical protein IWX81_001331 [Salinibacterium sp. CAN_S4]|uniref:hypothetical protein n=1 Tax=Salinibacterium sp. CAN_S4 TaxID=2787727 RepID=UPI0018EFFBE1
MEEISQFQPTMLTWPGMGGGSISLPYLESEITGDIPARFRYYGYLNDGEFMRACQARGIKFFGVVFCAQGWEVPAVLSADGRQVIDLNLPEGQTHSSWLGLREFSQNSVPGLWGSFESYFPDGLHDSRGHRVDDLWTEGSCIDITGSPIRTQWVEVVGMSHQCHFMDLNNIVWRNYLRAIIRIQIDSGVDGVQFDEPMAPTQYGGCFCYDCVEGFRNFLTQSPSTRHEAVRKILGAARLDIKAWLLGEGLSRIDEAPAEVADAYAEFTKDSLTRSMRELADYARTYAMEHHGRRVAVSANVYDALPVYDEFVDFLDVLVPEHAHTRWNQGVWTRYAAAFARGLPLCAGINPYNEHTLAELSDGFARGKLSSRLSTLMFEAAALGINLAVPYGSWMGNQRPGAMYVPAGPTSAAQDFIVENAELIDAEPANPVAVLYSVESNYLRAARALRGTPEKQTGRHSLELAQPPLVLAGDLVQSGIAFDVVFVSDTAERGELLLNSLAGYDVVMAHGCERLSDQQLAILEDYLRSGGRIIADDAFGGESNSAGVARLVGAPGFSTGNRVPKDAILDLGGSDEHESIAVSLRRVRTDSDGDRAALHLVNYQFDEDADRVPRRLVRPTVRLPFLPTNASLIRPGVPARDLELMPSEGGVIMEAFEFDQYAIVHLR